MKKLGVFVAGGLVGAAAALLAAPRPGDETRAIVTDWASNALGENNNITERVQVRRDQIVHDAGLVANQAGVIAADVAAKAKETAAGMASQVQAPQFGKKAAEAETDAELRARIEQARARIANQVAENAANARNQVGGTIPSVQDAAKDVAQRVQEAAGTVKEAVKAADEVRADVVEDAK